MAFMLFIRSFHSPLFVRSFVRYIFFPPFLFASPCSNLNQLSSFSSVAYSTQVLLLLCYCYRSDFVLCGFISVGALIVAHFRPVQHQHSTERSKTKANSIHNDRQTQRARTSKPFDKIQLRANQNKKE